MVGQQKTAKGDAILTLTIALTAIIAYTLPGLSGVLVYDRQAIMDGEIWRLLSAPLVHFSGSHLFWDVAVFTAAGLAINASRCRGFLPVCAFAALTPGVAYLLWVPSIARYGGLSALATGSVAFFCLYKAMASRRNRMIWLSIVAATGVK